MNILPGIYPLGLFPALGYFEPSCPLIPASGFLWSIYPGVELLSRVPYTCSASLDIAKLLCKVVVPIYVPRGMAFAGRGWLDLAGRKEP